MMHRVTEKQIAFYRMLRSGLVHSHAFKTAVDCCRALGGVQAQLTSAALVSIWNRVRYDSPAAGGSKGKGKSASLLNFVKTGKTQTEDSDDFECALLFVLRLLTVAAWVQNGQ